MPCHSGQRRRLILMKHGRRMRSVFAIILFGVISILGRGVPAPAQNGAVTQEGISNAYTQKVQPLKTQACGRCHTGIYRLIRAEGGRHKIDCARCHVRFHVFQPGKDNYEEVMPECETCHEAAHGGDLVHCLQCHSEPHAPLNIPADRALEQGCPVCHSEADKEIKTFVTQHTEFYCSSCHHTRHGYVPECQECHQPHSEEMTQSDCLTCHPPHKALEVVYPEDIPQEACAGCHRNAYDMLAKSGTKHAAMGCARCHPKHRAITRCRQCHPEPHSAEMLQEFRTCGHCHGVAHSLVE